MLHQCITTCVTPIVTVFLLLDDIEMLLLTYLLTYLHMLQISNFS